MNEQFHYVFQDISNINDSFSLSNSSFEKTSPCSSSGIVKTRGRPRSSDNKASKKTHQRRS